MTKYDLALADGQTEEGMCAIKKSYPKVVWAKC